MPLDFPGSVATPACLRSISITQSKDLYSSVKCQSLIKSKVHSLDLQVLLVTSQTRSLVEVWSFLFIFCHSHRSATWVVPSHLQHQIHDLLSGSLPPAFLNAPPTLPRLHLSCLQFHTVQAYTLMDADLLSLSRSVRHACCMFLGAPCHGLEKLNRVKLLRQRAHTGGS